MSRSLLMYWGGGAYVEVADAVAAALADAVLAAVGRRRIVAAARRRREAGAAAAGAVRPRPPLAPLAVQRLRPVAHRHALAVVAPLPGRHRHQYGHRTLSIDPSTFYISSCPSLSPSLGAVTSLYHFDTSTRPSFYPSIYLSTRLSSCYLMISSLFLSVSICPLKHCTSSIYRSILFYLPMLSTSKDQFTFLFVSLCPYHCTSFIPLDTHLFTYLSILSTYLFPIGISIQLPIYPSIYPFIYFIYPSILSICEKGEKLVRFRRIRKCGVLAKTISMELLYKVK